MSQRGRHTRAVSLLRCVLAMVTLTVAVLCVTAAGRGSPAAGAGDTSAATASSYPAVVLSADLAAGDEAGPTADLAARDQAGPTAPRPCEKKGLAEPTSTRGDLRVGEPSAAGAADTTAQRGTPLSSAPAHAPAGPAPPTSCASGVSTTVLRI
ncbi:hypothetical protein [Streptomyces sp. DH41]|uniref:hypothetical protein n=1 Tax=Streptomyces sp. DH41 TaxID=3040125 RepID=UPI0024432688|nr:hypothetical protein [Streptomyces sp. DH41]MDG9723145.1 hypothetical protein [Streptomyces sp. DH41]